MRILSQSSIWLLASRGGLLERLSSFEDILHPLIFVGFFAVAAFVILFRDRPGIRETFVVSLICGMLVVSLLGINPLPFTHLHKYSGEPTAEGKHVEIWITDASGDEIRADNAPYILAPNNGRGSDFAEMILCDLSDRERQEVVTTIVQRGGEYRSDVESGTAFRYRLLFPPQSVSIQWTTEDLDELGEFEGIRIYHAEYEFSPGGYEIVSDDKTLVHESNSTHTIVHQPEAIC